MLSNVGSQLSLLSTPTSTPTPVTDQGPVLSATESAQPVVASVGCGPVPASTNTATPAVLFAAARPLDVPFVPGFAL